MKFFANSFSLKRIFSIRDLSLKKAIIHFIIMVLFISFPLNFNYYQQGINSFNNITTGLTNYPPDWFPMMLGTRLSDCFISKDGLEMPTNQTYTFSATLGDSTPFEIVFTNETYNPKACTLVFSEDKIVYYNSQMRALTSDYSHVKNKISMRTFFELDYDNATSQFIDIIDDAFGVYFIVYFVFANTGINFIMNLILVLMISAIFLFVRINYQKVTSFKENINITVASMTIPALLGALIGMLGVMELNSYSVVIFQFATPLIALGAIFKGRKANKNTVIKEIS